MERNLEVPATFVSFIEKMSLPRIPQLTADYISFTTTVSFDHTYFKTDWEYIIVRFLASIVQITRERRLGMT